MPKAPNQKYKLFYILELLRSESDEKHPVTMPQIISYLKQNGIHAERKSVYSDMEALQILGYDVVCQKNPAGYFAVMRKWLLYGCPETPEEMAKIIKRSMAAIPDDLPPVPDELFI